MSYKKEEIEKIFNHEKLLHKYIAHVISCEGSDFIGSWGSEIKFTDEEEEELIRLRNIE